MCPSKTPAYILLHYGTVWARADEGFPHHHVQQRLLKPHPRRANQASNTYVVQACRNRSSASNPAILGHSSILWQYLHPHHARPEYQQTVKNGHMHTHTHTSHSSLPAQCFVSRESSNLYTSDISVSKLLFWALSVPAVRLGNRTSLNRWQSDTN